MNRKTVAFIVMISFCFSTVMGVIFMVNNLRDDGKSKSRKFAEFCIAQVYPGSLEKEMTEHETDKKMEVAETVVTKTEKVKKKGTVKVDNSKPKVIIYHTHSSESYQPYTESNFHRQEEVGTVRDVGNVMVDELNRLGIAVVHDKTIHDSPSYNESYDRSLETVTKLINKYPTAKVVIDLHRDAAAYTGNVGETMNINGDNTAKYKLVIGQNNDNYDQLVDFANIVNNVADSMFPGFSGQIIEKEYRYNEYVADNYLLLEVGNNQNNIKEVRNTGKYFARVLAKVLEEK